MVILVPARLSKADRVELVEGLVQRVLAQRPNVTTSDRDLAHRAEVLADEYLGGVRATSIRWVGNQQHRGARARPGPVRSESPSASGSCRAGCSTPCWCTSSPT